MTTEPIVVPVPVIPTPEATRKHIEADWIQRADQQGYKPGTKAYQDKELEFFVGAISALNSQGYSAPPRWFINAVRGDPIVEIKK